jgi:hypothetical protein
MASLFLLYDPSVFKNPTGHAIKYIQNFITKLI